ncbi:MAG: HU family DNA-binding protein [Balneolaceae bacterium]|nr:HU family DNA-binding protein [Balneolaceae bacterium]
MEKEFLSALSDVVRDQIVRKNEIHISGLGTFKQEHIQQYQKQHPNGQVVMVPPKDVVKFIPE